MKKLDLLTLLAFASISFAALLADDPRTYSRGFLCKISTGEISDVVYNYSETQLSGIYGSFVIGYAGNNWSNPLSSLTGFLTNVSTHELRLINVQGGIGGTWPTAIGGNIVMGSYLYRGTNECRYFMYKISDGTYRTNIALTNSYPWATNAYFQYTSETHAVAYDSYESNSYKTNYDIYNIANIILTNISRSDIIVYKISNGSNTLVKYPTNAINNANCYPVGISSNIVVGNWVSTSTQGSFYYNTDTGIYRELPPINGHSPSASAISGNVILGSWSESVPNSRIQNYYLFKYSTANNSYIQTNIPPVANAGGEPGPQVNAFEGNLVVGTKYKSTNWSDGSAYLYDMSQSIDNVNNPILFRMRLPEAQMPPPAPSSDATGISGDYVIGNYMSTSPIVAPKPTPPPTPPPTPVVSSGGGGGDLSVSKKKSAKKSSGKKTTTKKKSSKKRK